MRNQIIYSILIISRWAIPTAAKKLLLGPVESATGEDDEGGFGKFDMGGGLLLVARITELWQDVPLLFTIHV